jgi:hypothetical protein
VRVATQGSPYPKPKQKPHSLILLGRAPVVEVCNGYLAAARAVARRRHTAIAAGRDPTVVDSTARPGRGATVVAAMQTAAQYLVALQHRSRSGFIDHSSSGCYERQE